MMEWGNTMTNDKVKHLTAGAIIAAGFGIALTPLAGLALGIAAGVGKEVWDSFGNGTPDVWDAVATIAGALAVFVILEAAL